ncbi:YfbM family protein [Streptomyces gobiensis]|uniref:YfbM family protein n=1 Tax=Streptomyces gobiensis TaxID=2875706 RepID=UPI001E526FE0|nr:YfbM family protein [Streptomyces gobiensis]UGY92874.1 YfbM family protein [Streptomyces gobiensis]
MSMIGEYARVTTSELDQVINDSEWALDFVDELVEAELDAQADPSEARCLDTDKAWDALGFLLRRVGFPVDIVHGEEAIPEAEDWGYGPPRYLTPDQVQVAAGALAKMTGARLIEGVTPEELARADVYPSIIWERGESLDYVRDHYDSLVPFFEAAAREGDAMLVWLD